ncbi:hypothetical protein DV515_00007724, partial [Chloebia gouldiae]
MRQRPANLDCTSMTELKLLVLFLWTASSQPAVEPLSGISFFFLVLTTSGLMGSGSSRAACFTSEGELSSTEVLSILPMHRPSASTEGRTGMGFALTHFSAHFTETNLILTAGPEGDKKQKRGCTVTAWSMEPELLFTGYYLTKTLPLSQDFSLNPDLRQHP